MHNKRIKISQTLLLVFLLSGCATYLSVNNADKLLLEGKTKEGLVILKDLASSAPEKYRLKYMHSLDNAIQSLLRKASEAKARGNITEAISAYNEILSFDPRNTDALSGLALITKQQEQTALLTNANNANEKGDVKAASSYVKEILLENPEHLGARHLKESLDVKLNRKSLSEPVLSELLTKQISLQLRDATLEQILEIFSSTSGINFILDRDVKPDIKTTIFAKNTSIENALNLVLKTSQLNKKILNDSTFLIYQDTDEKKRKYEELVTRNFYLNNIDPLKLQEMVKVLVNPKSTYVDGQLKMFAVRDNKDVIETIERMVEAYDIASPEVVLEVEILEVNSADLLNAGIKFPDRISVSATGTAGKAGQFGVGELGSLNSSNFQLFFPDPLLVLNLKQTSSNTKTLANPRIRVTNNEKAKILIGDKVPVITTTLNQVSSASTESVSYLDVGLKLEVIPQIHLNNEVSINIALEVSNIAKEVRSTTGLLAYQIGTRNASTVLRLKDGETQVLAGLIKNDVTDSASHVPWIGKLPFLGRFFSDTTNNKSNSEIMLLITPHVVKTLITPTAHNMEYASGTMDNVSTHPLRLIDSSQLSTANQELTRSSAALPGDIPAPLSPTEQNRSTFKLSLNAPQEVLLNNEFVVSLNTNEMALDELEFDVVFDQPGVNLVKSDSNQSVSNFIATQKDNTIHIKTGNVLPLTAALASLTLKATQPSKSASTLNMSLQGVKLKSSVMESVPISVALPYQLTVRP